MNDGDTRAELHQHCVDIQTATVKMCTGKTASVNRVQDTCCIPLALCTLCSVLITLCTLCFKIHTVTVMFCRSIANGVNLVSNACCNPFTLCALYRPYISRVLVSVSVSMNMYLPHRRSRSSCSATNRLALGVRALFKELCFMRPSGVGCL